MISGQVIFSIVAVITMVCIVNKYLLSIEIKVFEIMDREQVLKTEQGHGCLRKNKSSKYLDTKNNK